MLKLLKLLSYIPLNNLKMNRTLEEALIIIPVAENPVIRFLEHSSCVLIAE